MFCRQRRTKRERERKEEDTGIMEDSNSGRGSGSCSGRGSNGRGGRRRGQRGRRRGRGSSQGSPQQHMPQQHAPKQPQQQPQQRRRIANRYMQQQGSWRKGEETQDTASYDVVEAVPTSAAQEEHSLAANGDGERWCMLCCHVKARCQRMCAETEVAMRMEIPDVDAFEKGRDGRADTALFVKRYLRDSVGASALDANAPTSVRPPLVLWQTMLHLQRHAISPQLQNARSAPDSRLVQWFEFVDDRLRAIRKDVRCQSAGYSLAVLSVLRDMMTFYVTAWVHLRRVKDFSMGLVDRGYLDTMSLWLQLDERRAHDMAQRSTAGTHYRCPRDSAACIEAQRELQAQEASITAPFHEYLLYRPTDSMTMAQAQSHPGKLAIALSLRDAIAARPRPVPVLVNYARAARLLAAASPIARCCLCRHIGHIRATILAVVMKAFTLTKSPSRISLDAMARLLLFALPASAPAAGDDSNDADDPPTTSAARAQLRTFLAAFGLECSDDGDAVVLDRANYKQPELDRVPWSTPVWIDAPATAA
ncbi:hypothetical protein PTSG_03042, partial [Salpingoeca rosetta]